MQMPMPDDWDHESFCRYAVCWPDSVKWKAILHGLLEQPGQGRFWDFKTGNFLDLRETFYPAYNYNFNLKGVIMACDDTGLLEIAEAIASVAVAINNQATASVNASMQCCDSKGSSGAGTTPEAIVDTPQGNPEEDPPPDGFDTWEDFLSNKCDRSLDFLRRTEASLDNLMTVIFVGTETALLIATVQILLSVAIPFTAIASLLGILAGVAANSVLSNALDILNSNEQELLCELYNGESPQSSQSAFMAKVDELIAAESYDPVVAYAVSGVLSIMASSEEMNKIYVADPTREFPVGDCSACTQQFPEWIVGSEYGAGWQTAVDPIITLVEPGVYDIELVSYLGGYVGVFWADCDLVQASHSFTIQSGTESAHPDSNWRPIWRTWMDVPYGGGGSSTWSSNTKPNLIAANLCQIANGGPMTIRVAFNAEEDPC